MICRKICVIIIIMFWVSPSFAQASDRADEEQRLKSYFRNKVYSGASTQFGDTIFILDDKLAYVYGYGDPGSVTRDMRSTLAKMEAMSEESTIFCRSIDVSSCFGTWYNKKIDAHQIALFSPKTAHQIPGAIVGKDLSIARFVVPARGNLWLVSDIASGKLYYADEKKIHRSIQLPISGANVAEVFLGHDNQQIAVTFNNHENAQIRRENWYTVSEKAGAKRIRTDSTCNFLSIHGSGYLCQAIEGKNYVLKYLNAKFKLINKWTLKRRIPIRSYHSSKNYFVFDATRDGREQSMVIFKGRLLSIDECIGEADTIAFTSNFVTSVMTFTKSGPLSPVSEVAVRLDNTNLNDFCASLAAKKILQQPTFFDPENITIDRKRVGNLGIPVTIIKSKVDGPLKGKAIIEAYGAFSVTLDEEYLGPKGRYWIEQGGTYVYAHVRGSAGFGPEWREAGYGLNKGNAGDDVASVARYLIDEGITTPGSIAAYGASAGAVPAMTAAYRNPDLFGAILLRSPCLMIGTPKRGQCHNHNEFGAYDNLEERVKMKPFSPYHLAKNARKSVPTFIVQMKGDTIVPISETSRFMNGLPREKLPKVVTVDSPYHAKFVDFDNGTRVTLDEFEWLAEKLGGKRNDIYPTDRKTEVAHAP